MKKVYFAFLLSIVAKINAQDSLIALKIKDATTSPLTFSGYIDSYYAYYTDSVGIGNFQKFPTTSPRSNSLGLNLAMITAKYTTEKFRSTISLHYGDIVRSSWSTDYSFLQEAHAGFMLNKKVWLDAGFFRTHIGTEGLYAKENITSSLAVGTYNEPYYQSGVRINYNPNNKLAISFFLLNGYNLYQDNNNKKSIGLLAAYTVNENLNIAFSNYTGDDAPIQDTLSRLRVYNNLFLNYSKGKFKMQLGGDFATQQHSDSASKKTATMFSALATFRYQLPKKVGVYTRGEIFNDPTGFLGGKFTDKTGKQTGYKLWGATFGIEYKASDNSYIRFEGRALQCNGNQTVFWWNSKAQNTRLETMIHVGVYF